MLTKREWSHVEYSNINDSSNILYYNDGEVPDFLTYERQSKLLNEFAEIVDVPANRIVQLCAHRIAGSIEAHDDKHFAQSLGAKEAVIYVESFGAIDSIFKKKYDGENNSGFGYLSFVHIKRGKKAIEISDLRKNSIEFFNPSMIHGIINNSVINFYVGWLK